MNKIFFFLALLPICLFAETTGTIDIGSNTLRIMVADVDLKNKTIEKVLFAKEYEMPLKEDLRKNGAVSEELQKKVIDLLLQVKKDQTVPFTGIGKAIFRKAKNSDAFLEKIKEETGIEIVKVSENEEGDLNWETAVILSQLPEESVVSFDSAEASFRITTKVDGAFETIKGDISPEKVRTLFTKKRINENEAKNVIEELKASFPKIPETIAKKLKSENTRFVGTGNNKTTYALCAQILGKSSFTKEELGNAIAVTHEFETAVPLIVVYCTMDCLGVNELSYFPAFGSCEGLFFSKKVEQ